jgi:tartrate dehydrogenase/decarboxylase/D-malate dehydrogenase
MMPEDGIAQVKAFDAIYLGAVGFPGVADHVSLWGLLIPLRRELDLYANVRPVRLLRGMTSPLAGRGPEDIDFIVVRENVEGEYSNIGGRAYPDSDQEMVSQLSVFTRRGTDRILEYAFELARKRPRKHVTSATKSNGIVHTMPYWDERFAAMAKNYPDIGTAQYHIDILTAHFVQHPDWFDVVVASNLFGDILSDLGPAVAGSIGIAPAANLSPGHRRPGRGQPRRRGVDGGPHARPPGRVRSRRRAGSRHRDGAGGPGGAHPRPGRHGRHPGLRRGGAEGAGLAGSPEQPASRRTRTSCSNLLR